MEGLEANFMGRSSALSGATAAECGSGAHFNHSLWDTGSISSINLMHSLSSPHQVSELTRHWVAGLAAHLPALTAIYCPTVNCYR